MSTDKGKYPGYLEEEEEVIITPITSEVNVGYFNMETYQQVANKKDYVIILYSSRILEADFDKFSEQRYDAAWFEYDYGNRRLAGYPTVQESDAETAEEYIIAIEDDLYNYICGPLYNELYKANGLAKTLIAVSIVDKSKYKGQRDRELVFQEIESIEDIVSLSRGCIWQRVYVRNGDLIIESLNEENITYTIVREILVSTIGSKYFDDAVCRMIDGNDDNTWYAAFESSTRKLGPMLLGKLHRLNKERKSLEKKSEIL